MSDSGMFTPLVIVNSVSVIAIQRAGEIAHGIVSRRAAQSKGIGIQDLAIESIVMQLAIAI